MLKSCISSTFNYLFNLFIWVSCILVFYKNSVYILVYIVLYVITNTSCSGVHVITALLIYAIFSDQHFDLYPEVRLSSVFSIWCILTRELFALSACT